MYPVLKICAADGACGTNAPAWIWILWDLTFRTKVSFWSYMQSNSLTSDYLKHFSFDVMFFTAIGLKILPASLWSFCYHQSWFVRQFSALLVREFLELGQKLTCEIISEAAL